MYDQTWLFATIKNQLSKNQKLPIKSLRLFFKYCPLHIGEICVWSIIWYWRFLYLYRLMLLIFKQYLKGILRNTRTFIYSIQSFIKNFKGIEMQIQDCNCLIIRMRKNVHLNVYFLRSWVLYVIFWYHEFPLYYEFRTPNYPYVILLMSYYYMFNP